MGGQVVCGVDLSSLARYGPGVLMHGLSGQFIWFSCRGFFAVWVGSFGMGGFWVATEKIAVHGLESNA